MKLYTIEAIDKLKDKYIQKGGEVIVVDQGSLVEGLVVCFGDGLKTCIIQEKYLNAWSSGQTIKLYNKTPKKYQELIE